MMRQLLSEDARLRLETELLPLMRRGADGIALAVAALVGLVISGIAYRDPMPGELLLLAHFAFWLSGMAFLRWLAPSGRPLKLSQVISGSGLAVTAALAFFLLIMTAVSRGIPSPSDALSLAVAVPSLSVFMALAPPAVFIGRRLADVPAPPPLTDDLALRRHQEALSIVFHELRRPLTTLLSASELAIESDIPEGERIQLLETVHRQAIRLGGYMDEMLEMARIQTGVLRLNPRPIDLRIFAAELIAEYADSNPLNDIELLAPETLIPVSADPPKLRMALGNLISNAVAYSPPGTSVTMRLATNNGRTTIEVEDEGPGIPEPYRRQVFEQFFRIPGTSSHGFGLGLYITRQLVIAHGGSIEVLDSRTRGSRFVVILPALREGALDVTLPREREESAPSAGTPPPPAPARTERPSR
jgi:signal transduction histidine kinase